jgi:hypothetical protein
MGNNIIRSMYRPKYMLNTAQQIQTLPMHEENFTKPNN